MFFHQIKATRPAFWCNDSINASFAKKHCKRAFLAVKSPDLDHDLRSYLKGLKEAPSSSTPIFHFVVFASNTHHGLAVQVELLIKGL